MKPKARRTPMATFLMSDSPKTRSPGQGARDFNMWRRERPRQEPRCGGRGGRSPARGLPSGSPVQGTRVWGAAALLLPEPQRDADRHRLAVVRRDGHLQRCALDALPELRRLEPVVVDEGVVGAAR